MTAAGTGANMKQKAIEQAASELMEFNAEFRKLKDDNNPRKLEVASAFYYLVTFLDNLIFYGIGSVT